jgi:hypothetical protein
MHKLNAATFNTKSSLRLAIDDLFSATISGVSLDVIESNIKRAEAHIRFAKENLATAQMESTTVSLPIGEWRILVEGARQSGYKTYKEVERIEAAIEQRHGEGERMRDNIKYALIVILGCIILGWGLWRLYTLCNCS